MNIDFNNVRRQMKNRFNTLVEYLNREYREDGFAMLHPTTLHHLLLDLRDPIAAVCLTSEPGNPNFSEVLEEGEILAEPKFSEDASW